jgi:electron transfer flavoprotein beta subunit
MRIIVCLKPVPDPRYWKEITIHPTLKVLVREGIPNVINPLDRNALEEALCIKESRGAEVVIVSMAPLFCLSTLREALAMGGDRAVLVSDRIFAGSDTLATSYVLSEAIKRLGPFDLILCGNETIDGGTAQVGPQLSEFLEIEAISFVSKIEEFLSERQNEVNQAERGRSVIIRRKVEHGYLRMEAGLPILLSVVKEINTPRYTTFTGILAAEKKEIQVWSGSDLEIDPNRVGLIGSPTKMADLFIPELKRRREVVREKPQVASRMIVEKIHQTGLI